MGNSDWRDMTNKEKSMALTTANDGNVDLKGSNYLSLQAHEITKPHLPSSLENVNTQRVHTTV